MLYRIRLSGSGAEIGIGKISKAQYDFWNDEDHEDFLTGFITGEGDDDLEIPQKAQLTGDYRDYSDLYSTSGIFLQRDALQISPVKGKRGSFKFEGDIWDFADDVVDTATDNILTWKKLSIQEVNSSYGRLKCLVS